MSVVRRRPEIPKQLPELMYGLCYEVIRCQPTDIIAFAADHFKRILDERERERMDNAAKTIQAGFRGMQARRLSQRMKEEAQMMEKMKELHTGIDDED